MINITCTWHEWWHDRKWKKQRATSKIPKSNKHKKQNAAATRTRNPNNHKQTVRGCELKLAIVSFCFYLSSTSLLFMRQGLFLNVAISFFFSSTCSFRAAISPSDIDSSSDSEPEELIKGKSCQVLWLWAKPKHQTTAATPTSENPKSSTYLYVKDNYKREEERCCA